MCTGMNCKMPEPSSQDLDNSIKELSAYRDRLIKEVINISKKLQMPKRKVDATLKENPEINKLERILTQLIKQRDDLQNS